MKPMELSPIDKEALEALDRSDHVDSVGSIDEDIKKESLVAHQVTNEHSRQKIDWQRKNIDRVFWLSLGSLVFTGSIILMCGFKSWEICFGFGITIVSKFHLSDKVLIAIISGTVVHILGLYAIVLKRLFPKE